DAFNRHLARSGVARGPSSSRSTTSDRRRRDREWFGSPKHPPSDRGNTYRRSGWNYPGCSNDALALSIGSLKTRASDIGSTGRERRTSLPQTDREYEVEELGQGLCPGPA